MNKLGVLLVLFLSCFLAKSQIVIDNTAPYNSPTWLVNNILLGGGVIASNHSFIGDPNQIGFFNGMNSNLGIDSGIVLSSGNVLDLVGPNASGSTSTSYNLPGDPTLDAVIAPDPTNDAAVLEFDFIPTSDIISFKYVFGSEEYLEWVNSFNDAFGFFLTGPNPAGGNYVDQNLAIVPGTANTPVTIDNVNDVVNSAYYVDNGDGFTAPQNTDPTVIQFDGFTTPLTAVAAVNCGDTYHIKLVVADAVDNAYDSGIFLEAGSFFSPPLSIVDDLGLDSVVMSIPCNSTITLTADGGAGATYQWFDSTSVVFSTNSSITVGAGVYVVLANIAGCAVISDTLIVVEGDFPTFDLGADFMIPCNADTLIDPIVSGGTAPYSYLWNSGDIDSMMVFSEGVHSVVVTDFYGCSGADTLEITYDVAPSIDLGVDYTIPCNTTITLTPNIIGGTSPYSYVWSNGSVNSSIAIAEGNYVVTVSGLYGCSDSDEIEIIEDAPGTVTVSGGGSICADGTTVGVNFSFDGLLPWDLEFTNGLSSQTIQSIPSANYLFTTSNVGVYDVVVAGDVNDCLANAVGTAQVIVHPMPEAKVSPSESFIYEGETIVLEVGDYSMYQWYDSEGLELDTLPTLTVSDSGVFYVWVRDVNGCEDESEFAIVHTQPQTNLFIPNTFTPNGDDHNELFVIQGLNIKTFTIQIFNRWGELLFMSESIEKSWDGTFANKKVQEGSYYYQIEVLGGDGGTFKKSGAVTVIY